jgi:quaternary ammonium compound-resistance protein SugE
MAWVLLVVAGLLEIVWATAVKQSDGFSRLGPSAIGISAAAVSFVLLSAALRSLPVGTAYAVWVGIGALGVAAAGVVANGEPATPARALFLLLILVGVTGLRALDGA